MEREAQEMDDKFLGEWHFPISLEMMRKWNRAGIRAKTNWVECLRDTNDFLLLKLGIYCICIDNGQYNTFHLWMNGSVEPISEPVEVLEQLMKLIPDQPRSWFISDYVPNIVICIDSYRWEISPELRVEFNSWASMGKQGLYVSGISTLPEYRDLVKLGENKFSVCLQHTQPEIFQKLWPNLIIEPIFFQDNEQNKFIEFHRILSYDEGEFDPDWESGSEEEVMD